MSLCRDRFSILIFYHVSSKRLFPIKSIGDDILSGECGLYPVLSWFSVAVTEANASIY